MAATSSKRNSKLPRNSPCKKKRKVEGIRMTAKNKLRRLTKQAKRHPKDGCVTKAIEKYRVEAAVGRFVMPETPSK